MLSRDLVPIAYQSRSPGLAQIALRLVCGHCRSHGELLGLVHGLTSKVSLARGALAQAARPDNLIGTKPTCRSPRRMSVVGGWSQPVAATLYLRGKRWSVGWNEDFIEVLLRQRRRSYGIAGSVGSR